MTDYVDDGGDLTEEDDFSEEEFNPSGAYSNFELMEWGDKLLKEDAARELCRKCKDSGLELPYGETTGIIESVPQYTLDGDPVVDSDDNVLYIDFPELQCAKGHRWYRGEGPRRNINGPNPILFESHLYNRQRREIYCEAGTVDPAFTMDRFGRPTVGIYNRSIPGGRTVNTPEQRKTNGASYYR